MKTIDNIISKLETSIKSGSYIPIETERIELKDLSGGEDWKELYKTVCAFLNSQGGIIIIGIYENSIKTAYKLSGFNLNNEEKLKEIPNKFTNDIKQQVNLNEFIRPDLFEIREFLGKQICILYIEKLSEDRKYVMYNGVAYERKLTGDHKIKEVEVEKQKELRAELELARELKNVEDATVEDLDIDKLNDYIQRLNQGMKVETLKADIQSAMSFLERKKFVVNGRPTLLGMLVCGINLYDFIGGRCQVDGFVESQIQIAGNKKIFKN